MKSPSILQKSSFRSTSSRGALLAVLFALLVLPVAAEELKSSRGKAVNKEAAAAAASGDAVKARELYQLVAAGSLKTPANRAQALYGLVMLEAGRPPASRDVALLESSSAAFLKEFPKDERRPFVAVLASLLAEAKVEATERAALEARAVAAEAELVKKEQAAAGATKDSSKKVEELEAKLRRTSNEVENLKAELAKKEEALKRLKKVAVGGGG